MDNLCFLTACMLVCSIFVRLDAVVGPKFTNSPEPIVAPLGDEVEFECSLDVPAEQIRWKHNRKLLPDTFNNASKSQLIFKVERESQVGEYQCVAWYGATALASTPARLSIASLGPMPHVSNKDLIVADGNNVIINCSAPASNPPAIIQYYRNHIPVQGQILGSGALLLTNVQKGNSGQYTCSATNTYVHPSPQIVPSYVNLNVTSFIEAHSPKFSFAPPEYYYVQPGMNVTLECVAYGKPIPKTNWRRQEGPIANNRTQIISAGLKITDIHPSDEGSYICDVKNEVSPALQHRISLVVQEAPAIVKGPEDNRVNEGGQVLLECSARGKPYPTIQWFFNGNHVSNDSHIRVNRGVLQLLSVEKRHAGWYQCMARNEIGTTFTICQLLVVPRQVTINSTVQHQTEEPRHHNPKVHHKHNGKNKKNSKEMVPPSKPSVTKLTDTSVMVRWHVPPNDGLPIQFFRVQHRELNRGKEAQWKTTNDTIPPYISSFEVTNLVPKSFYKFKIAAVYSNGDHKLGPNSAKFHLQEMPVQKPLAPRLTHLTPAGPESIEVFWEYNNSEPLVEGFFVYYRSTSSAGDYVKVAIDGEATRNYIITHLKSDTSYDFKIQSFTAQAASEFSNILTRKTEGSSTLSPPATEVTPDGDCDIGQVSKGGHQLYVTLGAVLGGLALLLILCIWIFCCNKHRQHHSTSTEDEDVDKSRRIQMEAIHVNGHIGGHVPVSRSGDVIVSKSNSNGCCSKMNITSNPLDPEENKTQNVMEIAFITTNSCDDSCSSSVLTARLASAAVLPSCALESESWRRQDIPRAVDNYV